MILRQKLQLFLCILEGVIQIIELDLAKLHILAVSLQKATHRIKIAVRGKTEMANFSGIALLLQIADRAEFCIVQIGIDVLLAHIVTQIKIKV